jgi:hypothetical protein
MRERRIAYAYIDPRLGHRSSRGLNEATLEPDDAECVWNGNLVVIERRVWRESVTCQPKCQIAVCGEVAGAAGTLVNRTRTSFGDASAGRPPQLVFAVVGNRRV